MTRKYGRRRPVRLRSNRGTRRVLKLLILRLLGFGAALLRGQRPGQPLLQLAHERPAAAGPAGARRLAKRSRSLGAQPAPQPFAQSSSRPVQRRAGRRRQAAPPPLAAVGQRIRDAGDDDARESGQCLKLITRVRHVNSNWSVKLPGADPPQLASDSVRGTLLTLPSSPTLKVAAIERGLSRRPSGPASKWPGSLSPARKGR